MGKLASNIKNIQKKAYPLLVGPEGFATKAIGTKIVGERTDQNLQDKSSKIYDQAHFLTTPLIKARDARIASENALKDVKAQPVMPIADEDQLARSRRKALSRRQSLNRSSTILGGGSESLG